MKMQLPFSPERAKKDAERIAAKVESGEAAGYEEANELVDKERAKRIAELEAVIDARIEQVILNYFKKTNQGNAGIIMKLNFGQVPPDVVEWLEEHGIELRENQVAKVLKFYNRGFAKQEFELQKKAHEALAPHEGDPLVAKVPRPHFWREVRITPATQAFLRTQGVNVGDRMEMIMMDHVGGEDLAARTMKDIMRRAQIGLGPDGDLHPDYRDANYDALMGKGKRSDVADQIAGLLKFKEFEVDPNKRLTQEQIAMQEQKTMDDNEKRLYDYLYEQGYELHPDVVTQIERAMTILHENGIIFRDGHQRNFMIEGELFAAKNRTPAPGSRVTIIDFGGAASFEGDYASRSVELYQDDMLGKKYIDDFATARKLKRLTVPKQERGMTTPAQAYLKTLEARKAQMLGAKPPRFQNELDRMVAAAGGKADPATVFEGMPGKGDFKFEGGLIALATLAEQGKLSRAAIEGYLTGIKDGLDEPQRKKIEMFLEAL